MLAEALAGRVTVGNVHGFTTRVRHPDAKAIGRVITALAAGILANEEKLQQVRSQAARRVPAVMVLSDLRLADVIIWTAQDDRMERPGKPRDAWLQMRPGEPPAIADVARVPLADH